ncbi:MAG: folate-binding protein [Pseudomonadota bacterium]
MTGWIGFHDTGRAVLRMTGGDARAVLQDVVTNDVAGIDAGPVYAALLTPQGKYLFDFMLLAEGADILIDVAAERAAALAQRLKMYALRRDAQVAEAAELSVSLLWPLGDAAAPEIHSARAAPEIQGARAAPDPRAAGLGLRIYAPEVPEVVRGGDRAGYDARRVALAVPESGVELVPEDSYILEAGFERLNGVDFRKGCYVGQEVTARMKHKTELRKGLVQVQVEGAAPPGTPLETPEGRPAGRLFTQADGRGLAHLRLDRAAEELTAGAARVRYPAG